MLAIIYNIHKFWRGKKWDFKPLSFVKTQRWKEQYQGMR